MFFNNQEEKQNMKVLFVYPEIQTSVTNTATYSLPLGLGAVATHCRRIFGDEMEVKILDGSMMNHAEQVEELNNFQPDIVGLSPTVASQGNAYALAEQAKALGAAVLFGGVNSTNLWKQMLTNRTFIDAVILFEGEGAMAETLRRWKSGKRGDKLFRDLPNMAYRTNRGEVIGPDIIQVFGIDELSDIDYSLFDLPRYFAQTEAHGFGRAVSYYAGKGCAKRGTAALRNQYRAAEYKKLVLGMRTCSFCGRNEFGFRCLPPEREQTILRRLHEEHAVRGFFNIQDTVNLYCEEPVGLDDSWFRLFIGAESITSANIRRLRHRYGPNLIFQVGIETIDPRVRRAMGKSTFTESDLFSMVEMLGRENLQLHASFIFGGRGETAESMNATARAARCLADYPNVTWILISPQVILPGSPDYRLLLKRPGMQEKWAGADLLDIADANRDFLRFFSPSLTREEILEEIRMAFADIKQTASQAVLDVKGVNPAEEKVIQPRRRYCE